MSYGGIDIEWLIVGEMMKLKKLTEEELAAKIPEYAGQEISFRLLRAELESRGLLDKYIEKDPELWL